MEDWKWFILISYQADLLKVKGKISLLQKTFKYNVTETSRRTFLNHPNSSDRKW